MNDAATRMVITMHVIRVAPSSESMKIFKVSCFRSAVTARLATKPSTAASEGVTRPV